MLEVEVLLAVTGLKDFGAEIVERVKVEGRSDVEGSDPPQPTSNTQRNVRTRTYLVFTKV
jgi:hypothetical protein